MAAKLLPDNYPAMLACGGEMSDSHIGPSGLCTVGATMIGTGSSMGAIGNGYNHSWGGAIYGLGASAGIISMLLFTKAKNKGFLTIAFRAIPLAGGYQNVVDTFTAVGKPGAMTFYGLGSYVVMAAIALVLSTAMGVIGTPTHRTRIYTSKDEKTARKAFLGQGMVNTMLLTRHSTAALPTLRFALGTSFCPRLMLTKAQQPSPIITAMASATTVRGKTTVLAALP